MEENVNLIYGITPYREWTQIGFHPPKKALFHKAYRKQGQRIMFWVNDQVKALNGKRTHEKSFTAE